MYVKVGIDVSIDMIKKIALYFDVFVNTLKPAKILKEIQSFILFYLNTHFQN